MSTRKTRPTTTRPAIEAQFAEQAYYQSASNPDHKHHLDAYNSDRARNYALSKTLIVLYMEKFKMDAREAREEVAKEMADKYPPNPWDESAPRKYQQRRGCSKDGEDEGTDSSKSSKYSEEQWDLFEKSLK